MKCLIKQPYGLGDILFSLKIGIKFCEIYDEVIWPLIPIYSWLKDCLVLPDNFNMNVSTRDTFPGMEFYNTLYYGPGKITDIFKTDKLHYYPICFAEMNYENELIMSSKYKMVNMEFNDWSDYVNIIRNEEKEKKLLEEYSGQYNLVNDLYCSPPNFDTITIIPENNEFKNEYLYIKKGFTAFDWMGVIENAESLHFVDTATSYIVEKCNIKTDKLFLYSRPPGTDSWNETFYLFKTGWEYK